MQTVYELYPLLVVGGIIGLRSHRKGIKNVDMILEQIRELQESEELLSEKKIQKRL